MRAGVGMPGVAQARGHMRAFGIRVAVDGRLAGQANGWRESRVRSRAGSNTRQLESQVRLLRVCGGGVLEVGDVGCGGRFRCIIGEAARHGRTAAGAAAAGRGAPVAPLNSAVGNGRGCFTLLR